MASILSSVGLNQSDIIVDKQLSAPYGAGAGGGGSAGGPGNSSGGTGNGDAGANFTTGTPPAIWFSYNSSSTHTIENSNASRHFADHPETSGAVGMEAIIIVVVVSLIPVSVIACMVFVISFNCLKRRSSLWSTTASPNAAENNLMAKARAQVARVDGVSASGGGGGAGNGRMSAIHSTTTTTTDNERSTDADPQFGSERGQRDHQSTMMDDTPLSLIYPADGFCAAYPDTSKSSLTTPISNNSVITMTMRNNHLIVETEERIPCSLLDGQHLYGGNGAQNTSSIYAQCQVEDYELNDDSLLDETDSFCENRYCQHGGAGVGGTTCVTENGCAFCNDDYDDDDDDDDDFDDDNNDDRDRNVIRNLADGAGTRTAATATLAVSSTTDNRGTRMQTDEEDQHVQLFHKNIATGGGGGGDDDDDASCSYECDRAARPKVDAKTATATATTVAVNTGYSQSDAGDSSRRAQNHYVYGNQSEYVASAEPPPARNKRFAPSRRRGPVASTATWSVSCSTFSHSPHSRSQPLPPQPQPPHPPTNSVHLRSTDSDDRST